MAKKLISYDDEKAGLGLPDVVEEGLNATYASKSDAAIDYLPADGTATLISTASMQARATNAQSPCVTPTADGSGQTVHPSVVYVPGGWNGYRYWMLVTGYADSNANLENPHLLCSDDGQTWENPPGISNPIKASPAGGFNSDTDMVLVGNVMYCFYRTTIGPALSPTRDTIYVQTTTDGATFTPEEVVIESVIGSMELVSPTLVHDPNAGMWRMWAVSHRDSPRSVILFESPAATGPWVQVGVSSGLTTALPAGRDLWHIEVRKHGGEYVAVFCDSPSGSASYGSLWRAVSRDGLAWDADPQKMMAGLNDSRNPTWDTGLYRATAVPAIVDGASGYLLWYSARQANNTWWTGRTFVKLLPRDRAESPALEAAYRMGTWYAGDLMDRPDSADGPGVSTSGHQWQSSAGAMGVESRMLSPVSIANSNALIDVGTSDMDVSVQIANVTSGTPWLIARAGAGSRGHLSFIRFGTTSNMLFYSIEWFNSPDQPSTTIASHSTAPQAGDLLRLVCKGQRIRAYVNGVKLFDLDMPMPGVEGNTRAGVQSAHSGQGFYNFAARPAR